MLPLAATLVMGALAHQTSAAGTGSAGVSAGNSALMGSLTTMLDQNRDGSMVDDVVGMVGKFFTGPTGSK